VDPKKGVVGRHNVGLRKSAGLGLSRAWSVSLAFADTTYLVTDPITFCGDVPNRACEIRARFLRVDSDSTIAGDFGELPIRRLQSYNRPARRGSFIHDDFLSPVFWAVRGSRFYHADSREPQVKVFGGDGRFERLIRMNLERVPSAALPQRRLAPYQPGTPIPAAVRPLLESRETDFDDAWRVAERPPLLRAYDGFLVDAVGNLWIKEYLVGKPAPPSGARWWVFDSTGVLRHSVRIPPIDVRQTRENPDPIEIGDDYILAVSTDSVGVQRVVRYRIRKHLSSPTDPATTPR